MVRNYIKKSNRCNWNDGQMYLAIQNVLSGKSCKWVANEFNIPRSTLQKKIKLIYKNQVQEDSGIKVGFTRVFSYDQEQVLLNYILEMESKLMYLDGNDIRSVAYEFAERLGVEYRFNKSEKKAGKDWLRSFMRRHELSHRKAKHTLSARINGFNKQVVNDFFALLKQVYDDHSLTPDRIYNVNEIEISVIPKKTPNMIVNRGQRLFEGLRVGERVTAEICMSAAGTFMPPMLIFPRVRTNPELLHDAPPGAWGEFHKSGCIQSEIFIRWMKKFIEFSQASPENLVLLLLDGYVTHIKSLEVIDIARDNGVIIICFPPYCTHKMQPLDIRFNKLLNMNFNKEVAAYQHQGDLVTLKNLFSIFGKAFISTTKMETAIDSFKECGIYPYNAEVSILELNTLKTDNFINQKKTNNSVLENNIASLEQVFQDALINLRHSQIKTHKQETISSSDITIENDVIHTPLSIMIETEF